MIPSSDVFAQTISVATIAAAFIINTNANISTTFSKNNVIVYFGPYVRQGDHYDTYDEEELIPFISKISSRFSQILTPSTDAILIERKAKLLQMPEAIAKFNFRLQNSSNRNETSTSQQNYMKAFLKYDSFLVENDTLLDFVLNLAQKANSIYPGTIEGLYAKPESLSVTFEKQLELLERTRQKIISLPTEKNNTLKLVTELQLQDCLRSGDSVQMEHNFGRILQQLDLVIFKSDFSQEDSTAGVEDTVRVIKTRFERCRGEIKNIFKLPNIKLGHVMFWPDTDFNGKQNLSSLVDFWHKMNNWAIETDTKVVFVEAFDHPAEVSPWKFNGWWRLVPNRDYVTSADYVFEEKAVLALNKTLLEPAATTVKYPPNFTPKPSNSTPWSTAVIVTFVVLLFLAIAGWLVFHFKKAIKKLRNQNANLLTKSELREFFVGIEKLRDKSGNKGDGDDDDAEVEAFQYFHSAPYNEEFEVERNAIHIDEESTLGSGNFGTVCLGRIVKDSSREILVAVKSLKKGCPSPATALKGLLAEIKVMSHLGKHENIVSLVGAYTKELKKGKVLVLTELCALGSLEKFLRKNRHKHSSAEEVKDRKYVTLEEIGGCVGYGNECEEENSCFQLESKALLRWSLEIACGMEFLASKHVVHADLATRNVLLTKEITAKISDFGLARRLYDYTNYVKSNKHEPLPWKWMAPESLLRSEFNEKTDVWAYGVTIWEIYSHGDVPYPGLSWNPRFANDLISKGLRLDEPRFVADGMYDLMLKCWSTDPNTRPMFFELNAILSTGFVKGY